MARQREEKNDSQESFYVGIHEPADLRREILESSKLMIHTLQSQKKLESIREEKEKAVNEFRRVSRDINLIVSKIRKRLPRTKLRALSKEEQLQIHKKAEPQKDVKIVPVVKDSKSKDSKTKSGQKQPAKVDPKQEAELIQKKKESDFDRLQNQLDEIESKLKGI